MDASNVALHDETKKPIGKVEKEQEEKVKVQEAVQQHRSAPAYLTALYD